MQKVQKLKYFLQVSVSLTIAVILIFHLDLQEFLERFPAVSLPVLGLVFLALIPSILVRSYRWKMLFENSAHGIRIWDSTILVLVGIGLNLALPASTGDIMKCYFGYKWSGVKERMLSISLLDKIIALGSISILGIPFAVYLGNFFYGGLSVVVLLPAMVLLTLPRLVKNNSFVRKIFEFATKITNRKLDFFLVVSEANVSMNKAIFSLVLSVLGWLLTYFQMFLCFRAVGANVPLYYIFSVAPLIALVRLFPFTLSGVGSDEAAMCYFFSRVGVSLEGILAGAVLYRLLTLILPGVVGLFFLAVTRRIEHSKRIGDQP